MTEVEKIQAFIKTLSPEDFARLRQWLLEEDWKQWDAEIERDSATGKLDFLREEALQAKARGDLKDLSSGEGVDPTPPPPRSPSAARCCPGAPSAAP
jgi:hypothetical protein